jgi:phytoene synthase
MSAGWDRVSWERFSQNIERKLEACRSDAQAWNIVARASRTVLRRFSSSFFAVTRFLPAPKRANVEVVYAAVRYPDEIVDTFPCTGPEKRLLLDEWRAAYEKSLTRPETAPWILRGFSEVVRSRQIPPEHYHAFLNAMTLDTAPQAYETLDDLIERYVYGSAVVVGYLLAHIYGPGPGKRLDEALEVSRELGIALQLTNFARDVREDRARGRLYLPLDSLAKEGLSSSNYLEPDNAPPLARAVGKLASEAESRYEVVAAHGLDAFAEDSRTAVRACIDVYRSLNRLILASGSSRERLSVPPAEKFKLLPASKFWRLPLAYMGAL